MNGQIGSWIYNIMIFLIFSSLLLQVVAEKKYEKYVKFFSGIIVMLLVISPVLNFFDSKNSMKFNYLEECFSQAAQLASEESENINLLKEETVSKKYSLQLQISLENLLNSNGYELIEAEIDLNNDNESPDYYYPKVIKAYISKKNNNKKISVEPISVDISVSKNNRESDAIENNEEIISLKSEIAQFFSMEEGDIILEIVS